MSEPAEETSPLVSIVNIMDALGESTHKGASFFAGGPVNPETMYDLGFAYAQKAHPGADRQTHAGLAFAWAQGFIACAHWMQQQEEG